jgi:hypothetical protein
VLSADKSRAAAGRLGVVANRSARYDGSRNAGPGSEDQRVREAAHTRWEKLTAVSSLIVALTGVRALLFAYFQIRESREQARVQHLVELVQEFDSPPVSNARRALAIARLDGTQENLKPLAFLHALGNWYLPFGDPR